MEKIWTRLTSNLMISRHTCKCVKCLKNRLNSRDNYIDSGVWDYSDRVNVICTVYYNLKYDSKCTNKYTPYTDNR